MNKINEFDYVNEYTLVYEILMDTLAKPYSVVDTDKALAVLSLLANFAWAFHPGRFVDVQLEYWASEVGKKISSNNNYVDFANPSPTRQPRILHVATATYDVGGHTRLLLNLIKSDPKSIHSLVLTRQKVENIPEWLKEAVSSSGGALVSLASQTYSLQVTNLQRMLCCEADKIFYHIHPDDSVAVAALAAVPRPQVMTINHADHVFWLGSALSDITVCFRVWSLAFSLKYRNSIRTMLLPTPLNFLPNNQNYKQLARKYLGIQSNTVVILTVASSYKFIPSGQYNYYKTIKKMIDKNSNVIVQVIGIGANDNLSKFGFEAHDRIQLLGVISEPLIYYQAADIYLDSMPFSSFTSLFEAMYFECFPVLQFNPVDTLNLGLEPAFSNLVSHSCDEAEQLAFLQHAIENANYRAEVAKMASESIKYNYMGEGWNGFLKSLYEASSEPQAQLRDLRSRLAVPVSTTEIDVKAAILSNSFNEPGSESLLRRLGSVLEFISVPQFMGICFSIKKRKELNKWQFSLRQISWFIKRKILSNFSYR